MCYLSAAQQHLEKTHSKVSHPFPQRCGLEQCEWVYVSECTSRILGCQMCSVWRSSVPFNAGISACGKRRGDEQSETNKSQILAKLSHWKPDKPFRYNILSSKDRWQSSLHLCCCTSICPVTGWLWLVRERQKHWPETKEAWKTWKAHFRY